ncbi:MAG: hypothetical protein ACEY3J_00500 [Arsenophonus sp.]
MSTSIDVFDHHCAFAIYLIGDLGIYSLILLSAYYLAGISRGKEKHIYY